MKFLVKIQLYIFGIVTLLLVNSCSNFSGFKQGKRIFCDLEKLSPDKKSFVADNPAYLFSDGKNRTDTEAHSGKYSVMATKNNPYVLSFTIKNTEPDMFYKVSVWRKSKTHKGILVVSDKTAKKLYQTVTKPLQKDKNGWEKLELDFFTPPNFHNEDVKVYCWDNTSDTIYFDDIEIHHTQKKYPVYKEEPLVLVLDTLDYKKLIKKRIKAFNAGVLQTNNNDWVKGMVFGDGKMMKAKMRLKGDWLDHLIGDKWSFRIKMRKNYSWKRLRVFSIQTPFARGFLYEWFSHKLYESQDILTTRYGFVPVVLGNTSKGLYAWEEHFAKQLIESRKRREGPILKFSEDAFWQLQVIGKATRKWPDLPFYNVSVIEPFSQGKTIESPTLFRQFLIGQKLMNQYKYYKSKPDDIFDLPKLAKYYAMLEITHARHGMFWHNQRLYYNPVICKLEPIAYDGYTDHVDIDFSIEDNMAYKLLNAKPNSIDIPNFYFIFEDTTFIKLYLAYLEEFSSKQYVDSMNRKLTNQVDFYDSLINEEFPQIHFDKNFLSKSARATGKYLPTLKKFINSKIKNNDLLVKSSREEHTSSYMKYGTPPFFVSAFLEDGFGDSLKIGVHNFFGRSIKLIGTGVKKKYVQNYFQQNDTLPGYVSGNDGVTKNVYSDAGAAYLFFQVIGFDELYSVTINPWPYPTGITPRQELQKTVDLDNCPAIDTIIEDEIYIKKGTTSISKPLIIPKGFKVLFEPGTNLDITNRAMFISYSPVFMRGTKKEPVVISSSDKTANGFTVLQATGRSQIVNTRFEAMNTLNYKGWTLSGAVTFYESDVDISHGAFDDNQCEDALNIVRSDFVLKNSTFNKIWGDAFDSDFSTGLVDHVLFTNIGNDAIDFSTGKITIANCTIRGVQDKGVSGGEDSHLTVKNTIITQANIGLASKDLSSIDVFNTRLDSCNYGVVLLQKKPEYGPATMNLHKVTISNTKTDLLIEKGSKVIFNGKVIKGDKKKVAEMFY